MTEENTPKKPKRVRSVRLEKEMIAEAGGLCAWCGRPEKLEVHHIDGDRSRTLADNLIALCGSCHDSAQHSCDPSPADLHQRKLEQVYRRKAGIAMARNPAPQRVKRVKFVAEGNSGPVQQAEQITNNIFHGKKPPRPAPAPDSISAHAAERGYLEYLRREYIDCRLTEQHYGDKRRFAPAQASNTIKSVLGYMPNQAPITSFEKTWRRIYALVLGTLGARKYKPGYRPDTWPEYQAKL